MWDQRVVNGQIKKVIDEILGEPTIELGGTNISTNYIVCPVDEKRTLGIEMPYIVLQLKNMNKYFTFEVCVLDQKIDQHTKGDKQGKQVKTAVRRRFRASNYQTNSRVMSFISTIPLTLEEGWNQVTFDLSGFCMTAYGTRYLET